MEVIEELCALVKAVLPSNTDSEDSLISGEEEWVFTRYVCYIQRQIVFIIFCGSEAEEEMFSRYIVPE